MKKTMALAVLALLHAPAPAPAPDGRGNAAPRQDVGAEETVRVDTNLVTVPAVVTDRAGRYVANLRREDFRIVEDGVGQEVAFFASVESPFTVALLIDTSGSTRSRLAAIVGAANAFVDRLRPADRLVAVTFDSDVQEVVEPSLVRDVWNKGLKVTPRGGGTCLYDALNFVINKRLRSIPGRKAIILLTDGVDGNSRATSKGTLRDAEELDAFVFPVRYNTFDDELRGRKNMGRGYEEALRRQYRRADEYLQSLARKTGGRLYHADEQWELARAFDSIVEELGHQYSLGYYPSAPPRAGERRQLKVSVLAPGLTVRARDSYVRSQSGERPQDK